MASGVNKVLLLGHLGQDPETKHTQGGTTLCTFSLATNESYKDKNGDWQDRTEWHRIVAWGKTAEICGKYLAKGSQVFIEGSLKTRTWEDDSGQKRYMTEVHVRNVQFLGSKGDKGGQGGGYDGPPPSDDDIPF